MSPRTKVLPDIMEAVSQIAREKNVSMDIVIESLKAGIVTAANKVLKGPAKVEVSVDREKNKIEVFTKQKVVEIVSDPENEILLEEAKKVNPKIKLNEMHMVEVSIDSFRRSVIHSAKQMVVQNVKEAERSKIYEDYNERMDELITGTVQKIEKGNILVNLGRTEALLPIREQIKKERYKQGDTIRALIVNVEDSISGAQIILSRTAPTFLRRLFELEVPEIYDGIVEVKAVSRDPGNRSKIAVVSNDERVDPVGACVGMKGNRVQAVVRELSNERIDIINWNEEITVLVKRALAPAETKRIYELESGKLVVIVLEESLAQAIGKAGQNIRLTSQLIGREIDIYGADEWDRKSEEEKDKIVKEIPIENDEFVSENELSDDDTVMEDGTTDKDSAEEDANVVDEESEEKENV